jgi:hypothetical protein
MAKAMKVKQLLVTLPNKVGLLSEVTAAIAVAKVNITAICGYEMENNALFMMTTESNAKAKKALAPMGGTITEEDVIAVEMANKAGELMKISKKIADAGININYIYGTSAAGKTGACIVKTADDKKAIKLISK